MMSKGALLTLINTHSVQRLAAFAALGLTLTACNELPGSLKQKALEAVRNATVEPEATQFRNVTKIRGNICGELNAKNRMGGYVGFQRFYYSPDMGNVTEGFVDQLEADADYIMENPKVYGITSDFDITGQMSDVAAAQCAKEARWERHCTGIDAIEDRGIRNACIKSGYQEEISFKSEPKTVSGGR